MKLRLVVCLAILLAAGCHSAQPSPLPDVDNIQDLRIAVEQRDHKLELPLDQWTKITGCILPATIEEKPLKWDIAADVWIREKGGDEIEVTLYRLRKDGPAAFSVGADKKSVKYYRGGNDAAL